MAKIQRRFHLPDEAVVVVLYTLASHSGLDLRGSLDEAILLAYGFAPPELMRASRMIVEQRGWGKLFRTCQRMVAASRLLCDMLRPAPWSDEEARRWREQIAGLPETPYPELRKR